LHKARIGDGITDDALYRSGLSNKEEAMANKLAADILMPWHLINLVMDQGITTIPELAKSFHVSESAMSIRLGIPC
jgi:Zn-dependent peptidase ImmA (M78 family)